MAGWGDDWGFDWGNAILLAAVTPARIQITASVPAVTVDSPSSINAAPLTIAASANVRVPSVLASNVITFAPGRPFVIQKFVNASSAISRTASSSRS